MTYRAYIVDVFASEPLAGNPLAVICGDEFPGRQRMQGIAAEMNFSETTFVRLPARDGKYAVRIFTPVREIEFTGHPLIGTAYVIRRFLGARDRDEIDLQTAIGSIRVSFERDADGTEIAWMQGPAMQLGKVLPHDLVCESLGLTVDDLDSALPVQVVSAGTAALMVPLKSADALFRARLDLAQHAALADQGIPKLVYLFCRETRQAGHDFQVRFFFEADGVREDPATGNGAAFFGAYLLEHRPDLATGFNFSIEQGHGLRRPSLIRLRGKRLADGIDVQVGGSVYEVLQGEMLDA